MVGQVYNTLISLAAMVVISRYLGVEKFGDYGFILAVCTIFMVIEDMGMNQISIREMARNPERGDEIFTASIVLRSLLGIVTFFIIVLVINILSSSREVIIATYICGLAQVLFCWGDIFLDVFKANERMRFVAISTFWEQSSYLLFVLLFIKLDWGLNGIFIASLLSYLSKIIYGSWITFGKFFRPTIKVDLSMCGFLFKEGFPMGISRILRKVSLRVDTILLKLMRTSAEAGIFHGPYKIIQILMFIPRNITDAVFPVFSRHSKGSKDTLNTAYEKSFKFLLILAIPLIVSLIFSSKEIIMLVLGEKFIEASNVLVILSFVVGFMFFNTLFTKLLTASDRQAIVTICVAICIGVNLVLDLILIPLFGYMGAAVATLIAEGVFTMFGFYFVSRYVSSFPVLRIITKPILTATLTVILCYFINGFSIFLKVPLGLVFYSLILFITGTFDQEELRILKPKFLQRA